MGWFYTQNYKFKITDEGELDENEETYFLAPEGDECAYRIATMRISPECLVATIETLQDGGETAGEHFFRMEVPASLDTSDSVELMELLGDLATKLRWELSGRRDGFLWNRLDGLRFDKHSHCYRGTVKRDGREVQVLIDPDYQVSYMRKGRVFTNATTCVVTMDGRHCRRMLLEWKEAQDIGMAIGYVFSRLRDSDDVMWTAAVSKQFDLITGW